MKKAILIGALLFAIFSVAYNFNHFKSIFFPTKTGAKVQHGLDSIVIGAVTNTDNVAFGEKPLSSMPQPDEMVRVNSDGKNIIVYIPPTISDVKAQETINNYLMGETGDFTITKTRNIDEYNQFNR